MVHECRDVEERYNSNGNQILNALEPDARFSIVKEAEHGIIKQDYTLLLSKEFKFYYFHLVVESVGWKKF